MWAQTRMHAEEVVKKKKKKDEILNVTWRKSLKDY